MTDHKATAKRLLPCDGVKCVGENHWPFCPANFRPAVTGAFAELSHSVMGLETCCDSYKAELEDVRADRDNWKGRFETMEGFWRDLKAERDEARKEPTRLYYEYEQHLQTLNAENESLKAECDAAFVKGLKLARKIVHDHLRNPTVDGWYSAIQAEIDKAGKNDLDADYLQAERDESFFNGLKRAKEVVGQLRPHQWVSVAVDAIQAEIDKAGKP